MIPIIIFGTFALLILLVVLAVVLGGIGMSKRGPPPESGSRTTG